MNPTTEMALWLVCGSAIGMFLGIAILVGAVFILVNIDDRKRAKDREIFDRQFSRVARKLEDLEDDE